MTLPLVCLGHQPGRLATNIGLFLQGETMIKKTLLTLALAAVSSLTLAAGPYDGAYQKPGSTSYLVVLQNGTTLAVAVLASLPTSGISFDATGGKLTPSSTNLWSVATGPLSGNVATVAGTTDMGACTTVTQLTFDSAGNASAVDVSSTPTAFGLASQYKCGAVATPFAYTKIF